MSSSRHRREAQFEHALGAPAGALPPALTINRMDVLRRSGRPEDAVALLRKTVTAHPDVAVGLLVALRAAARVADTELLLDVVAELDPRACARVAGALGASRDLDDLASLLNRIEKRGLPELAATAVACEAAAGANPLTARLLARSAGEIAAAVAELRRLGRDSEADDVVTVFSQAAAPAVRDAAVGLAKKGLRADAATLLHRSALVAAPDDAAESFLDLARGWASAAALVAPVLAGRGDSAAVLAALYSADPDRFPGALLEILSPQHVARLCGGLSGQNAPAELDAVLTWCAARTDAAGLRSVLHEAGLHALGYRLAERMDELAGPYDNR